MTVGIRYPGSEGRDVFTIDYESADGGAAAEADRIPDPASRIPARCICDKTMAAQLPKIQAVE